MRFALNINNIVSVFEKNPNEAEINNILSYPILDSLIVVTALIIYLKITFLLIAEHGRPVFFRKSLYDL